jgi:hypothetical protein
LQKGSFPRLPGSVKHPVELVGNIAVKLGINKAICGGEHIVIPWIAGAGSVEKANRAFWGDGQHGSFLFCYFIYGAAVYEVLATG